MVASVKINACQLVMRIQTHEPFAFLQDDRWQGIDVEQGQALAGRLGCQLSFVVTPWARGIELLKAGKVDFMASVSRTPKREKLFYFVGPQRNESIRLVSHARVMRPMSNWQQLMRLNARIMVQRGAFYGERFERVLRKNYRLRRQLIETVQSDIRLELVQKERVDGFVVDKLNAIYMINTNPKAQDLYIHPLVIHESPVYFAFSRVSTNPNRIIKIDKVVDELISDGTFGAIIARYQ